MIIDPQTLIIIILVTLLVGVLLGLTLPRINDGGFFLHPACLLVFRWEKRVEAVCPEAFDESRSSVPVCPTVRSNAFARILRAAL